MNINLKKSIIGFGFLVASAFSAHAAVMGPGDLCGNKYIALSQDGMVLSPSLCTDQDNKTKDNNSTGNFSPISVLGWISGAETQGNQPDGNSNQGDGSLGLVISGDTWTITNPTMYPKLGISVKQGAGFAFYELDLAKALTGLFKTGNNASPTGNDFSHINAWRMGTPVNVVPLPAAAWMLLAGLGGIAAMKRRKKA